MEKKQTWYKMKSWEINIKNQKCYYFDDKISINDLDLDKILLKERSYDNIWIYEVACKTPYAVKLLCSIFDEVDEYIRKYGTKYLVLFHSDEKYECKYTKIN